MTPAITPDAPNAERIAPYDISTRSTEVTASRILGTYASTSKAITLQTKEDDIVSLSLNRETVAVYGHDARMTMTKLTAVGESGSEMAGQTGRHQETEWLGFETRQDFSITIEGDLSRAERRDIRKAIRQIDRIMHRSLATGKPANVALGAPRRARLDSLASIDVDYRQERTLLSIQTSQTTTQAYSADGRLIEPASMPATNPSEAQTAAADEVVETVRASGIAPHRFMASLKKLFARLAEEKAMQDAPKRRMVHMLERSVLARIRSMHAKCPDD